MVTIFLVQEVNADLLSLTGRVQMLPMHWMAVRRTSLWALACKKRNMKPASPSSCSWNCTVSAHLKL
jgi:hypothetical protein